MKREIQSTEPAPLSVGATILLFSPLQFFMWALFSCFLSYMVHYLRSQGYSPAIAGSALTVLTLAGILGQFFWGWASDITQRRKWVFTLGIGGATGIAFLLLSRPPLLLLFLIMALLGFFQKAQPAVLDSWIFAHLRDKAENFGLIRSMGSLGFALFSILIGFMIETRGWSSFFIILGSLGTATVLFGLIPKDLPVKTGPRTKVSPLELLKIPGYFFILLVSLLLAYPLFIMMLFLAPLMEAVGGGASWIGIALFINAIVEIPVFSLSGYLLRRFSARQLLITAASFFALRMIILMISPSPLWITLSFLLQSFSFGLFLPSVRYIINKMAPEHLKTSAMSSAEAFYGGIGGAAAGFFGGLLLETGGVAAMLTSGFISSSLAVALLIIRPAFLTQGTFRKLES